jgi:hypothetical protein
MDKLFPGSYPSSKDDLERMWREATIAFDANALLHIYRYGSDARTILLDAMERVSDRLWVPYQAAAEFHRNRVSIINEQTAAIDPFFNVFSIPSKHLRNWKHHSSIDLEELRSIASKAEQAAKKVLDQAKKNRLTVQDDALLTRLTEIVGDRFGQAPAENEIEARYEEGRKRFERGEPPGYADADKPGMDKYGDYLIWHELLDYATANKRPVILVTDDGKEDWWVKESGTGIGPRHELVSEMLRVAGVRFHLSTPGDFVTYAQQNLGVTKSDEVIEEIREVSRAAEAHRVSASVPTSAAVTHPGRIPGILPGAAAALDGITGAYVTQYEALGATLDRLSHGSLSQEALDLASGASLRRALQQPPLGVDWAALNAALAPGFGVASALDALRSAAEQTMANMMPSVADLASAALSRSISDMSAEALGLTGIDSAINAAIAGSGPDLADADEDESTEHEESEDDEARDTDASTDDTDETEK